MINTNPLFHLEAEVATPQISPGSPLGERRFIPVTGGTFTGERLNGKLLSGGSDCQLVRADGVADLDVRVTLQCDDDTIIFMKGLGLRHGPKEVLDRLAKGEAVDRSEYYFRETMMFEASAGTYEWMNKIIAIGIGERQRDLVVIDAFELL